MPSPLDQLLATVPHLQQMPRREIKALRHDPYSEALELLVEELGEDEAIATLTCATSASRGRGVLALTPTRLVLFTLRRGLFEWSLSEIEGVSGRPARFTMPAAIYLEVSGARAAVVVGAGRVWGPLFTAEVSAAVTRVAAGLHSPVAVTPAATTHPAVTSPSTAAPEPGSARLAA